MKKHISPINNLKNLNLIINSDTYKLAHEDIGLLSRNEMRGELECFLKLQNQI